MKVIADTEGQVYAYRDGSLLVIVRGLTASPFGPAYEPVRRELVGRCQTLGYRGPNTGFKEGDPEWSRNGEVSTYKVWDACPPYEHECAEVMAHVVAS